MTVAEGTALGLQEKFQEDLTGSALSRVKKDTLWCWYLLVVRV